MVKTGGEAKKEEKKKKKKKKTSSDRAYNKDMRHGESLADKFYAPGTLTRIENPAAIPGIDTEMQGGAQSIAQAEDFYNKSGQRDEYIDAALRRGLDSLQGFDSAEGQALKAQALRGIRSDQATTQRANRQAMGEAGIGGAAALRLNRRSQLDNSRQVGSAMTDLAVANINAKQSALNSFGNLAQGAYGAYQGAQNNALQTLLGARTGVANYRLGAQTTNADIAGQNANRGLEVQKANADQQEKEISGRIGTIFGSMGVDESRRNARKQDKLAKKYLELAQRG